MVGAEKESIINSFNRAETTYDNYCAIQVKSCERLIKNLRKVNFSTEIMADFGENAFKNSGRIIGIMVVVVVVTTAAINGLRCCW